MPPPAAHRRGCAHDPTFARCCPQCRMIPCSGCHGTGHVPCECPNLQGGNAAPASDESTSDGGDESFDAPRPPPPAPSAAALASGGGARGTPIRGVGDLPRTLSSSMNVRRRCAGPHDGCMRAWERFCAAPPQVRRRVAELAAAGGSGRGEDWAEEATPPPMLSPTAVRASAVALEMRAVAKSVAKFKGLLVMARCDTRARAPCGAPPFEYNFFLSECVAAQAKPRLSEAVARAAAAGAPRESIAVPTTGFYMPPVPARHAPRRQSREGTRRTSRSRSPAAPHSPYARAREEGGWTLTRAAQGHHRRHVRLARDAPAQGAAEAGGRRRGDSGHGPGDREAPARRTREGGQAQGFAARGPAHDEQGVRVSRYAGSRECAACGV